nr:hypothetical protein [Tanacetum cinerariifolium]
MSRDVLTIGSTMRIPLLYRGEYSQWVERFMNYLEEQTDGEAMITCIKNGDQPLPRVTQVSIAGTSSTEQPPLKDKSIWSDQEKKIQKIDRHATSRLIQGLPNDIYSLIDSNKTAKDLWDALARHMLGSEYGEQDRKAAVLYEYEMFKSTEGELLLNIYIRYLQVINDLKKCGDVNDAMGLKNKTVVVTSDPLALIAEKTKKITALLAKSFNRRKFYSKPTNNNLRTSSTSQSANKKQEFVKSNDKKVKKKDDDIKRDISKVKCYNCKKEGHFAKDCKKVKVNDYEYYETKMLLAKKYKDEQVFLAKDQAWMKSSSDSDQEINANMVFMAQIEKKNKSKNDCQEIEKVCDRKENPNVIAPGMFKLSESQSISPISVTKTSCASSGIKNFYTFISVRRPNPNGIMWMRKGSSNTVKVDLSSVNHSNLNKNVKRYSHKNLMACNNSDTCSAFDYNNARNALCNVRMNASVDVNELFVFDDIVQICLWIIDSGCSKHMTGNRALLTNFVEKFLRTVRFWNSDFAVIAGYGDVGLEVAYRKSTCFVRNEYGVDFLTCDRSSNLYTIALNEVASNSSTCLQAKAFSLQSWLWHQRLSHLNFAIINNLVKNNLVQGLPKMKFEKDHLCSACEQGKIHQKHHKSKTAFASNKPLYLLHMDFCGPMCVESINGKRYVLVVVDDYSWNRTLVEAARTMLTFANLPLFLWAEAIATACFTQNRSIIYKRFDKTPYELMNKRKPNIKFFRVFGCSCYLLNNYEDVGKFKVKRDIRVFVGYSKESAAFRIYNKRTRKIYESVNVNFDEISEMAYKQFSLEPGLSNLNETGKSLNPSVLQVLETSNKDLEDLFQKFYDEYFDSSKIMKSSTTNVETSNVKIPSNEEEVFHESSESFQEKSSSSSLNDDVQRS